MSCQEGRQCFHWLSLWHYLEAQGTSKSVISRVISTLIGVTPILTLLITDLLSPVGLQVWLIASPFPIQRFVSRWLGFRIRSLGFGNWVLEFRV